MRSGAHSRHSGPESQFRKIAPAVERCGRGGLEMRPIIARETSLSAMCGRLRVGKDFLHARRLRSNDEWSPVCYGALDPPVGGTFWFQIFIQAPSPEIWSETISGGEEALAQKWGGLVLGYLLGKNFRRRDRERLVPPRCRECSSLPCRGV